MRLGEGEGAARVPVHEGSVPQAELHKRDVEVGERDQGDLSYLESMPAEVREQIAGELDTHELGSLSQVSTTMRDTSVAEGMKRLLGPARDGDGGLINSDNPGGRMEALQGIAGMLAHTRLSPGDRSVLLELLVGKNGEGGLVRDANPQVRQSCVKVLGSLLLQGIPGVRNQLSAALVGGRHGLGLIQDADQDVADSAARLLVNLLQNEGLSTELKDSLLAPILGKDGRRGMLQSRDPRIQKAGLKVVGNLMLKSGLDPALRKQFLQLILGDGQKSGLMRHSDAGVRKEAFNCLGKLMCSDNANLRFKS